MYVIANHHTAQFDAWDISAPGVQPPITYQDTYGLSHAGDPAGVAVDSDSETLFITSENDPGVELVDAKHMTSLDWSDGPTNLAGIDIDEVSDTVYAVKRAADDLYVYDWDPGAKTLTLKSGYPKDLPNCTGAFGLALDSFEGLLYVADSMGATVRVYDAITLEQVSTFTPSIPPMGIDVDRVRGLVYTTAPDGSCAGGPLGYTLLCRYELATGVETTVDMGHGGMGVAVDETTGHVYVTGGCYGDDISIWDSDLSPVYTTGAMGNPAGIAIGNVSYNPLNLAKNDTVVGHGVYVGQQFSYKITYDNADNTFDATGVVAVDRLPAELDFVSETLNGVPSTGVYDTAARTVTWDIGTLTAGYTGGEIELVVLVNQNATSGTTIYNYCEIDSDQTPLTTVVGGDPDNPNPEEPGTDITEGNLPIARASDIAGQPQTMSADTVYSVTCRYYDPDGRGDLKHCLLQVDHPTKPLTMMWYQATGIYGPRAGEEGAKYLTVTDVDVSEIANGEEGYELTWSFKINSQWPEVQNAIDFGVFASDDADRESGWDYDDRNASFGQAVQHAVISPWIPSSPGEVSEIMEGGLAYRYYQLRDTTGAPIAGATVFLNQAVLSGTDPESSTSDADGIFSVCARASELGPSGTVYLVEAVNRVELGDVVLQCDVSAADFTVFVRPMEWAQLWQSMHACTLGVSIGKQVSLGVLSLKAAAIGLQGGTSIGTALGYEMEGGVSSLVLERRFGGSAGAKVEFAKAKVPGGILQVGTSVEADFTFYQKQRFEVDDPLGTGAEDAENLQAAFFWDVLVADGTVAFPLIGPLISCIIRYIYDDCAVDDYITETAGGTTFEVAGSAGFYLPIKASHLRITLPSVGLRFLGSSEVSFAEGETRFSLGAEWGGYADLSVGLDFTGHYARYTKALTRLGLDATLGQLDVLGMFSVDTVDVIDPAESDYFEFGLGFEHSTTHLASFDGASAQPGAILHHAQNVTMAIPTDEQYVPDEVKRLIAYNPVTSVVSVVATPAAAAAAFRAAGDSAILGDSNTPIFVTTTDSRITTLGFSIDLAFILGIEIGAEVEWIESRSYPNGTCRLVNRSPWIALTEEYDTPPDDWLDKSEIESSLGAKLGNLASRAWDKFASVWGYVKDTAEKVVDGIVEFGESAAEAVEDGFHMVVEAGKDAVKGAVAGVISFGKEVKGFLTNPFSVNEMTGIQSLPQDAGELPIYDGALLVTNGILVTLTSEEGVSLRSFLDDVDLRLTYSDGQLAEAGLTTEDEEGLGILHWDAAEAGWDTIPSVVDPDANRVSASIRRVGLYYVGLLNQGPEVQILHPQAGDRVRGVCTIRWDIEDDQSGRDCLVDLYYASASSGEANWILLADEIPGDATYDWNVSSILPGRYVLRIVVEDPFGLTSEAQSSEFEIQQGLSLDGPSVVVAPNPVRDDEVSFYYQVPDSTSEALLRIFCISGRELFMTEIDPMAYRWPSSGFWSPVDEYGVRLANGPYLCVLVADGRAISQAKMVIQRQ